MAATAMAMAAYIYIYVQLEKSPRSSETCSKNVYLTVVNHEQSLFNCLTILFSSIFIHILGVLQISFIYFYIFSADPTFIYLFNCILTDCKEMDPNTGRLRPRTDDQIDRFLQAFRATTEKFIADLGQLLQESILAIAFRRSFKNADSEIYTGMDKITTTLSQLQRHFEKPQ